MAIGAIINLFILDMLGLEGMFSTLYLSLFLGFIAGLIWAERIRRTIGILTFHSYLLSTPEIEGWRNIQK
ncbi:MULTISPECIES: hypothetical protein [unclassified Shewanella]|uniref:hypothetical protein n=1 Tax=unclassified Shewanella TaxID=196818 RepID=UPI000C819A58|nr:MULTISPECIES: hypothetical protein [unclassified Shewanella]MDO6775440.1 hypothetical protein [Shewanella sp. 3_MG-2023]PMH85319.1 hypothetical protein BCU57_15070 [Shewanella sp. 10N.286.48.B5]